MFSRWKWSVLTVCSLFCLTGGWTAFADTSAAAEAESTAETEAATEEITEEATEEATEPEQITSGEYTYYVDEEYEGAVIVAYEPKEAHVVIPEEIDGQPVVALESSLFNMQDGIETLTLPATLRHIGASAFYGTGITEFIVDDENPAYKTVDGVLFSKDGVALIAYPPKKTDTSYTVPDGVEELYHGCFAQCTHLEEITLPDGLIYIDSWAFAYTILQKLVIPDTVTDFSSYACAYMPRLTDVTLSANMNYIGSAAFAGCAQLTEITLPQNLLEIGQGAFAGTGLKSIVIPASVETIGYCAFGYSTDMTTSYSNFVIYGLAGSIAQTYASDRDEEYDYKNNFTFIAKTEQELAEGLAVDENGNEVTSGNESVDVMIEQQEDESSFATIMKIALMVLGGIVLCGGIAAVVLSSKKKKN